MRRAIARSPLWALAFSLAAAAGQGGAQTPPPPPSSIPPPMPPPPIDACIHFPASLIGTRSVATYPSLLPGRWLSAPLRAEDLEALARLVASDFRVGIADSHDQTADTLADLHAATLRNLRSGAPIAELARRQRLDHRLALPLLRTPLASPRTYLFTRDMDAPLRTIALVTWLLEFKAVQAAGTGSDEDLLNLVEPLTEIAGMSLDAAIDHFTFPGHKPGFFQPDLEYVELELRRPGGWTEELVLTRALLLSLDLLRGGPAARTELFRDVDRAVNRYFVRAPEHRLGTARSMMRTPEETEMLLDNRLFLERRSAGPAAADPDGPAEAGQC